VTKQQEEQVVVLGTSGRDADFVMAGGENNCAHEHHALSDGCFWLPHILLSFPLDMWTNVLWTQRSVWVLWAHGSRTWQTIPLGLCGALKRAERILRKERRLR
jgi:hypothetical protein